jgi:hypothetical protein
MTSTGEMPMIAPSDLTFVAAGSAESESPRSGRLTRITDFERSRKRVIALALVVLFGEAGCTGSPSTLALQPDFAMTTPIGVASVSMRESMPGITDNEFSQMIRAGMDRAAPGDLFPGPVQRPFPEYRIVWHVFPYGNHGVSRLVVNIFKVSVPFAYEQGVVGNSAPSASIVGTIESMSERLIGSLAHAHMKTS